MPIESPVGKEARNHPSAGCTAANLEIPHFDIAGIDIAAIDLPGACNIIAGAALSHLPAYVTVTGAHGIVESVDDENVRHAHQEALMVVPDGMPLVWLGRILGYRSIGRVYGPDLMQAMFSNKEYRDLRHFFYGSNASVITALVNVLVSRFGQFNFVGSYSPPMRPVGFREDDDTFPEWQAEFQYLLQLGASTNSNFRLISIGNLIPLKGYHLGLNAFARAGIENSEYWIIGDGWQRKRLEHLARRLGVAERVRIFGARSRHEVLKLLAQSDALVHPSLHDSGGWACLEAMSAGRPVLCLNLGGPATQVTREVGFCCSASFPAVAINALAAAMVRLASEPALCETLGQAGRRRIREHYLLETRIQYFLDCYRRALTQ